VAKIEYTAPNVRDVTDVSDIGSTAHPGPLDGLVTESTNIDSSNLREEGLDLTVFAPKTTAELVSYIEQDTSDPRFVIGPTGAPVWQTLNTVNAATPTLFETAPITLDPGDALEIRATIQFVSDNATSAGPTSPGPYGLGPLTPPGDPSIFGLRIGMDHPGGVGAYLIDTERFLGGGFTPTINNTIPGDNEIPGRHGSLCVMSTVPSQATLIEPPGVFAAGAYTFRLEYRLNFDVCVRQVLFYIIKYPRVQEVF
jgi:hypothetical protein